MKILIFFEHENDMLKWIKIFVSVRMESEGSPK